MYRTYICKGTSNERGVYPVELVSIKEKSPCIRDAVRATHSQCSAGTSENDVTATGTRDFTSTANVEHQASGVATWIANWVRNEIYLLRLVRFRARHICFSPPAMSKGSVTNKVLGKS